MAIRSRPIRWRARWRSRAWISSAKTTRSSAFAARTQLRDGLEPLRRLPIVGDVRVIGGVGVVELVNDKATKQAGGYLDASARRLAAAFLERGLLLRRSATSSISCRRT